MDSKIVMKDYPEYPDIYDKIALDLALDAGCNQFLLAKAAMKTADDVIDSYHGFGKDCHFINIFKARCLQHGLKIEITEQAESKG